MRLVLPSLLGAAAAASLCDQAGWHVDWTEDFDALDENVWTLDVGPPGDSRTRDAEATADSCYVEDGALVIRSTGAWNGSAVENMTSGAVESKRGFRGPARVCVRARLPGAAGGGRGVWPAHWLMPRDASCWPCHGEIDVMEMIDGDGRLHGTYHWCLNRTCGEGPRHLSSTSFLQLPDDTWSSAWHEYAVEYSTEGIRFAFDGEFYFTVAADALLWNTSYYVILNTALGGPWPQQPDETTTFPAFHLVDSVRVAHPAPS